MIEKYIVTSTGEKDNAPYSILSRVVSGVKDNGDKYEFIDSKSSSIREAEQMRLGVIVEYEVSRAVPKSTEFNINAKPKE